MLNKALICFGVVAIVGTASPVFAFPSHSSGGHSFGGHSMGGHSIGGHSFRGSSVGGSPVGGKQGRGGFHHGHHHDSDDDFDDDDDAFFFVGAPFYPYPYISGYVAAPTASPNGQYWYYCPDSKSYYPYVRACSVPWQPVPATPPQSQ